jgi:hypothetical protein
VEDAVAAFVGGLAGGGGVAGGDEAAFAFDGDGASAAGLDGLAVLERSAARRQPGLV